MSDTTSAQLRQYVERIERLIEERRGICDDIRDVYAEAKAVGFDTRTIRALVARRAMPPDARAEADVLLETYESALGGDDRDLPDSRPDTEAIALAMLAEQVAGMDDPEHAAVLVDHVLFLLDLRAEIALLRKQESERKALAKAEGFDAKQIAVTVRWFEKVAKFGLQVMRAAEETFRMYRSTVDSAGPAVGHGEGRMRELTGDPKLGAMFAPPAGKQRKSGALARRLAADAEAARRALGDD